MYGAHHAYGLAPIAMTAITLLAPLGALLLSSSFAPAEIQVSFENLRNNRGELHLCLTRNASHFPDCGSDPNALKRTLPANGQGVRLTVAPGVYAVSVFHDEDRDRQLDTFLGIPREGFGFSRNPTVRFGAPRFNAVAMNFGEGFTRLAIRMQYLL